MTGETSQGVVRDIAEMWQSLLDLDHVAAADDFFDIGGSSITAIRLVPLLQERFGVEPDITVIFDHPTPVELARALATLITEQRVGP
jgi:acyl carrier protein